MEQKPLLSENEISERLVPVVLGADILSYSYVRSFYEAYGIHSVVLASADVKFVSSSRFCQYHVVENIDQSEALFAYLSKLGKDLTSQGKLPLLVGTGDWYARIFSEYKEYLSQWFVVPYIDFKLLDAITQKEHFYKLCEELGMDYPKTYIYDCNPGSPRIDVDQLTFPVIAKPSNSARYHYAEFQGKKKIFEVETAEELLSIHEKLKESCYDRELIVQDFIPGSDDDLYSITTFTDDSGEPEVVCAGRVILQDHAPSALGNPVCIIDAWPQKAIDQALRFLKAVSYHGFANFDVKYDRRDDTYKFFEINTRPGRNTFYMNLAGVNFVTLIVDEFVLGRKRAYTEARNPYCYACVPATVVKRTLPEGPLRTDVLKRYKSGQAQFPLFFHKDTLAHRLWSAITYYHQISKFDKYVWKTGGKQADAD